MGYQVPGAVRMNHLGEELDVTSAITCLHQTLRNVLALLPVLQALSQGQV